MNSKKKIFEAITEKLYGELAIDPASPNGDYGCAIRYKINKKGQIVVKSIKYMDAVDD